MNIPDPWEATYPHSLLCCKEIITTSDIPPTHTINPIDQPPDSEAPTAAMLKADIDSGATGDKTEVFDPGMAMLGICEEAAGTSLTPTQLAWARREETFHRWKNAVKTGIAHNKRDGFRTIFVGFIALIGAILVSGITMVRM